MVPSRTEGAEGVGCNVRRIARQPLFAGRTLLAVATALAVCSGLPVRAGAEDTAQAAPEATSQTFVPLTDEADDQSASKGVDLEQEVAAAVDAGEQKASDEGEGAAEGDLEAMPQAVEDSGPAVPAGAARMVEGQYVIECGVADNKVLDASGKNPKAGAKVTSWTYNGGANATKHFTISYEGIEYGFDVKVNRVAYSPINNPSTTLSSSQFHASDVSSRKRFAEDTNNKGVVTVTATLTDEELISESSDREDPVLILHSEFTKVFVTKHYYMIQTVEKMVYVFKKGAFSVGKEEEFLPYVQQIIESNKRRHK